MISENSIEKVLSRRRGGKWVQQRAEVIRMALVTCKPAQNRYTVMSMCTIFGHRIFEICAPSSMSKMCGWRLQRKWDTKQHISTYVWTHECESERIQNSWANLFLNVFSNSGFRRRWQHFIFEYVYIKLLRQASRLAECLCVPNLCSCIDNLSMRNTIRLIRGFPHTKTLAPRPTTFTRAKKIRIQRSRRDRWLMEID